VVEKRVELATMERDITPSPAGYREPVAQMRTRTFAGLEIVGG
jgi:hypothetical protein